MMAFKLNFGDLEFTPGQNLVKNRPDLADEFAKYLARAMKHELIRAIRNQRYDKSWAPLTFNYRRYKIDHKLSLNVWEATGLLKKSIVARKRNGYYEIGVHPTRRYNNGARVIDVAKWMEYGTTKMPPRPLFRPIIQYIRKNIGRYFKKFCSMKGVII